VLEGKLDRFSADSNALREDLRSFMNTFVKEKSKEFSTKDSGVGGAESGGLLSVPKDLPNPQMQDQSNIDNIATVEELLGAEYKTLGALFKINFFFSLLDFSHLSSMEIRNTQEQTYNHGPFELVRSIHPIAARNCIF